MANNIVVAIQTAQVTSPAGLPIIIHEGAYWPADDPVVLAYPSSFSTDLRYNLHSSEPLDDRTDLGAPEPEQPPAPTPSVEQATAAPGEKRTTKRTGE